MRTIRLGIITLLSVTFGCQQKTASEKLDRNELVTGLTYLPSNGIKIKEGDFDLKTADSVTQALYVLHYLGDLKDSIPLHFRTEERNYSSRDFNHADFDATRLSLIIDTTTIIGLSDLSTNEDGDYVRSFPALLLNRSADTLNIGTNGILPLTLEARDISGVWHKIEEPFVHYCNTDITSVYLPPGQVAITTVNSFEGPYETHLRLSFEQDCLTIKSNEFIGTINLKQLKTAPSTR